MKQIYLLLFLFSTIVFGQNSLIVIPKDSLKQVEIQKMDIKSSVFGNQAVTEFTVTIYNPFDDRLSGEINFPLQDGDFVYGYALDVNGELRDAVGVERAKARAVFESIVSRGVDPGLVEKTQGNVFKTRVYPIPPKGTRIFRLNVLHQLKLENDIFKFSLPVQFSEKIKDSKAEISVYGYELNELIYTNEFQVKQKKEAIQLSSEKISENMEIQFKNDGKPKLFYQKKGNEFYYNLYSPISSGNELNSNKYKKISILWDVSRSRKSDQLKKEIQFLEYFLNQSQFEEIQLIAFNNQIQQNKIYTSVKILMDEISTLNYDGATQFGILKNQFSGSDLVLLFSDGLVNFGDENFPKSQSEVYTITASAAADFSKLKMISKENNGLFVNLYQNNFDEATKIIQSQKTKLNKISPKSIDFPMTNSFLDKSSVNFSGKSTKKINQIKLKIANPNQTIQIPITAEIPSKYLDFEKLFALHKINELSLNSKENEQIITDLGKKYNLVSDYTSLLVLEDLEDYVKNEIFPPTKDLQREYSENLEVSRLEKQIELMGYQADASDFLMNHLEWTLSEKDFEELEIKKEKINENFDKKLENLENKYDRLTGEMLGPYIQVSEVIERPEPPQSPSGSIPFIDRSDEIKIDLKVEEVDGDKFRVQGFIGADLSENQFTIRDSRNRNNVVEVTNSNHFEITVNKGSNLLILNHETYEEEWVDIYPGDYDYYISQQMELQEVSVSASMTVSSQSIEYVNITSFDQALSGKVSGINISEITASSINNNNYQILQKNDSLYVIKSGQNVRLGKNPLVFFDLEGNDFEYVNAEEFQSQFETEDLPTYEAEQGRYQWNEIFSLEILSPEMAEKKFGKFAKDGIIFAYTRGFAEDGPINLPANIAPFINQNLSQKQWTGMPEYIQILEQFPENKMYGKYLELAETYGNVYSFYLAVADLFERKKRPETETILSNVAEIDLNNSSNMRTLGYKLRSMNKPELAVPIFEKVLEYRPDEPISYRDLGISYILSGQKEKGLATIKRGIDLEWLPLLEDPDDYLETINTYFNDYKGFGGKEKFFGLETPQETYDLRFVLTWTANDTDIDLHLVTPSGEDFYYGSGSNDNVGFNTDVTTGYGPEEILVKKAEKGNYQVLIDFYADSSQIIKGPVALTLEIYKHFGTPKQERIEKVFYLTEEKDDIPAGVFSLD